MEVVSNAVAGINHDLMESSRLATVETLAIGQNVQKCVQGAIISVKKPVEGIVSDTKLCVGQRA